MSSKVSIFCCMEYHYTFGMNVNPRKRKHKAEVNRDMKNAYNEGSDPTIERAKIIKTSRITEQTM